MKLSEAKAIGGNPGEHQDELMVAHLKLQVAALRAFPSSPRQRELCQLIKNIEAMPRDTWAYVPKGGEGCEFCRPAGINRNAGEAMKCPYCAKQWRKIARPRSAEGGSNA